ncbi:hypothetical protein EF847_14165 [Actinobacteria bacterium YIM 96077]|uniref:NlpC/P60 domain-containing protein n=2 Tax=Phytoactinopolyspora halophila TaxID=1981511 RepID=A0A329QIR2_9ACTN|nr:hypothetical protein EF847_14165 [Actinobacteria bacterium YIM 96077]RAW11232.1 hypothetical protein DPM12_17075 [Phytoactinopolyspora halophila]
MAAGIGLTNVAHADPDLTLDEAREEVDELNQEVVEATERYHVAGEELDEVERRLERAENAIEKQEAKVEEAVTGMAGFAAASYQSGGIDPTVRTIFADDPVSYLGQASLLDAYARQQAAQVDTVMHERRQLEQAKLMADEERDRMEAIKERIEDEKASIEDALAESEEILDGLEEEERQRLEEERRQREREEAAEEENSRGDDRDSESDEEDGDGDGPDVPPPNERAQAVVDFAMAQRGDMYEWGAAGPDTWDCSGLTSKAWEQAGVSLPRSSSSQIEVGTRVSRSQLQPGDLVFYYNPISHVAIYIGDGQIVHATSPGNPVRTDSVDLMPFAGASRPG